MKPTTSFKAGLNLIAAAIALTSSACGDGSPTSPPARVYTGDVPGTDVRVGIIAAEHHARVFFCGGATSYATSTGWLTADIDAAHKLSLASSPWVLHGDVSDAEVTGTIDMGNAVPLPFHTTIVSDRTISGLYEGTAGCGRLGLIVIQATPDSTPVGQGACVGPNTLEQVNPLDPIVRTSDGTILVKVASSPSDREVRPATPPVD